MLSKSPIVPVLPSTDLEASNKFFGEVLGLKQASESNEEGLFFECGGGTNLAIYYRPEKTKAEHTVAGWLVDDIEDEVARLTAKGVIFEQYDMPDIGLKTNESGIATDPETGFKAAWFKDPDGNILAVNQMS
jgi:catechol 2,3-dioxygenase-like lactoylglutathione lyase family enzyme